MDRQTTFRSQIIEELESLRRQFVDLRGILIEPRKIARPVVEAPAPACGDEIPPASSPAPLPGRLEEVSYRRENGQLDVQAAELEEISRGMNLLAEMGDTLRACLSAEEVFEVVARTAWRIYPAEAGALYIQDRPGDVVASVATWGDRTLLAQVFAPEECWAIRRGRVHCVADVRTGLPCRHLGHLRPARYLCLPLLLRQRPIGVLHLAHIGGHGMPEAKVRLATTMADQIAIVLSNLRLQEETQNRSSRDLLTGLFTANFMRECLGLELSRAARNKGPLGVIAVELDGFTALQESFGQDAVLALVRQFAGLLRSGIRKEDIACRYDERRFLLLLPQAGREVTRRRAEHLRRSAQSLGVGPPGKFIGSVSVSAGVSFYPEHGGGEAVLLQAAESALRRAIEAGGDTVVVAGE